MLSQGLVKNLAAYHLKESAYLQLSDLEAKTPAKSLGSKIISTSLYGKSNLRHDPGRSQQLLEELITKQGIPKINVKKGDLITRKGESITQKRYDVLDYFGMISRTPKPIQWFWSFGEALSSCLILLMIMRRERPSLKSKHTLLALGLLLISQIVKDWFGAAISPLQLLVPPTFLLSQGIGTLSRDLNVNNLDVLKKIDTNDLSVNSHASIYDLSVINLMTVGVNTSYITTSEVSANTIKTDHLDATKISFTDLSLNNLSVKNSADIYDLDVT